MRAIEKMLEVAQGNAYPAMLEDLANHLGVSADSLRRLALGWLPVVPFKKGPSFLGWWTIPEREVDGTPVGLSLRSQNDLKVMYPGSKHGLIYEVNPQHEHGEQGYSAGAHNWVRTADAGLLCPVCGKPDGCLLSAEDPNNPRAVVCRVKHSDRPLKFGFLHILKPEGKLNKSASALAGDVAEYVLVVEGMSDAAAGLDLGFAAVGRPSNLAGMDQLRDLCRGRRIIVIGENDQKSDGTCPGREGMTASFQTLQKVCSDIKMVMPPSHVKDLRAWKSRFGLTRDAFLSYVEENGQEHTDMLVLDDDRPLTIARGFLGDVYRLAGRYTLKRWFETWYQYQGSKYAEVPRDIFESLVYQWAHGKQMRRVTVSGGESIGPLRADIALVTNVTRAAIAETVVTSMHQPCWINGKKGPDPKNLIVFNNGILDVVPYLAGEPESEYLLELTPDFFTTIALPIAFDPTATCPVWETFLQSSLGDDQAKIDLLQEWFGYCLIPDTTYQKMMYLRGPTCAGKSKILDALRNLVGPEQTASTSFGDMIGPHGTEGFPNKAIILIPDARTPRHADLMRGLEILLNISAGDPISINPKNKTHIPSHKLTARITISSNEFLEVLDHSGAMIRRLNVIEFTESFVGREDFQLGEKLEKEVAGIAVWALSGLRRLREQNRFTVPASSLEAVQEWRRSTSPLASFLEECTDAGGEVLRVQLFDAYTNWARERKIALLPFSKFVERVKANAPQAISETYEKGGQSYSVYRGLSLKPLAAKKYTGRPV